MSRVRFALIAMFALAGLLAGCGSDDEGSDTDASSETAGDSATDAGDTTDADTSDANDGDSNDSSEDGSEGGGSGGSLTIAGETIKLGSTLCFLEEQDSAGGGGKILFTAQGSGVNADNDVVTLDVSRYDEDSQFAGDDISVTIGDPFSPDAETLTAREETGTITVDGSTVSADEVTFSDEALGDAPGSFEILC